MDSQWIIGRATSAKVGISLANDQVDPPPDMADYKNGQPQDNAAEHA
jgi:hypothetical protein